MRSRNNVLKKLFSCFDRLSTNGNYFSRSAIFPFALSLSKGERSPAQPSLLLLAGFLLLSCSAEAATTPARKLDKVKLTVPAKSLTFFPYYFGKDQRIFEDEGIDLELIVIRPPLGVVAL